MCTNPNRKCNERFDVNHIVAYLCFIVGNRRRALSQEQENVFRDIQASEEAHRDHIEAQREAQRERHVMLMMEEARQEEASLRVEMTENSIFNQALLSVLGRMARAMEGMSGAPQ